MVAQILQISNGFLIFESLEDLANSVYFKNKTELVEFLGKHLPDIEDRD